MKTYIVPHTDLKVSSVVLGLMRIADLTPKDIRGVYDAAIDSGINFFDHADVYGGGRHRCEQLFADALGLSAEDRPRSSSEQGGHPQSVLRFSRSILRSVEGSLKALRTEYPTCCCCTDPMLVEPESCRGVRRTPWRRKVRHFASPINTQARSNSSRPLSNSPCCSIRFNSASPMRMCSPRVFP